MPIPRLILRSTPLHPLIRMSSSTTTPYPNAWAEPLTKPLSDLHTYLATVPDFIQGSKRLEVRPQHLENSKKGREIGWIVMAGATFASDHGVDDPPKMTGSWFLLREETLEKARERLSKDIYVRGGAWDMNRATIQAVAVSKT